MTRGRGAWLLTLAIVLVAAVTSCAARPARTAVSSYPADRQLSVDDLQVVGTHNSYHLRPSGLLGGGAASTDYAHAPIDVQLEQQRVRSFELDVYNNRSDFPVLHTPLVDSGTNCSPIASCLATVVAWSARNPGHVPLFVLLEPKTQPLPLDLSFHGWDRAALDQLDTIVRASIGAKTLLTPDRVRGSAATLRDAVTRRGWPTLRAARGTIAVVLNTSGSIRDDYLRGRSSLQGAAMFVTANPAAPSAAFVKRDTPDERAIRTLVRSGFVVRTRADADLAEARLDDTGRAAVALRSGAQIVSTDVPVVDPKFPGYVVTLPRSRAARCNPVTAPKSCRSRDLENPRGLRSG